MQLTSGAGGGVPRLTGTTQDISERKRAEEQIRFLAYFDGLTRLPNRTLFNERLRVLLPAVRRQKASLAVLFLDLDRFKGINDTLGHTTGDRLLQEVSERFRRCVRATDTVARPVDGIDEEENVARLGGDEFIVSVPELKRGEDAARVARRILTALEKPIRLDGHEVVVGASIGISLYPQDGEEIETLLENADVAMYKAKEAGGNRFEFYERTMTKAAFHRLSLEATLRKALERREFELYFQPQVDVRRGLVGAEALIRWQRPERGLVPPLEFIPLAEEIGLIVPIGEWVLHEACAQAKTWQSLGVGPLRVAVNLSGHQFRQRQIVEVVRGAVRASGIDPAGLDVEITESALMHDAEETVERLRALREMGVGIALDDFGTGYSALGYLKSFPITCLKIDRVFVREVTTDPGYAAITAAIIGLARGLHLTVIAEGVETGPQLALLEGQGCSLMQGYLFGRPVPAREFLQLVEKRKIHGWVDAVGGADACETGGV